jgi:hypothetical protein
MIDVWRLAAGDWRLKRNPLANWRISALRLDSLFLVQNCEEEAG